MLQGAQVLRFMPRKFRKNDNAWPGLLYLYEKSKFTSLSKYAEEVMGFKSVTSWHGIQGGKPLSEEVALRVAAYHGLSIVCASCHRPHPELLRGIASVKVLESRIKKSG